MSSLPLDVVNELLDARRSGNRIRMNALCAPAYAFTFNADPEKIGPGTTVIGWAAVNAHLDRVKTHWHEEHREVLGTSVDQFHPEKVHVHIAFRLRNRQTDRIFEGRKRMIFVVRDGIVQSCEEILDASQAHAAQHATAPALDSTLTPSDGAAARRRGTTISEGS